MSKRTNDMRGASIFVVLPVVIVAVFAACAGAQEVLPTPTPAPAGEQGADPSPVVAPGPPTPVYTCLYTVTGGNVQCLPVDDPLVKDCFPIQFGGSAACPPPGAGMSTVINEFPPGTLVNDPLHPKEFAYIRRGNSIIKWAGEVIDYYVLPDDEADFKALKQLFGPPAACRFAAVNGQAVCLPPDDPLVHDCRLVNFQDFVRRWACLPPGAEYHTVEENEPSAGLAGTWEVVYITRGSSVIRFAGGLFSDVLLEYSVTAEDEMDFIALKELFGAAR